MQGLHPAVSNGEKQEIEHVNNINNVDEVVGVTIDGNGLLKSRFDEMSIPKTLWVFRRVVLVTLAVYTGYMCEGFEVRVRWCSLLIKVGSWWLGHCQSRIHQAIWRWQ